MEQEHPRLPALTEHTSIEQDRQLQALVAQNEALDQHAPTQCIQNAIDAQATYAPSAHRLQEEVVKDNMLTQGTELLYADAPVLSHYAPQITAPLEGAAAPLGFPEQQVLNDRPLATVSKGSQTPDHAEIPFTRPATNHSRPTLHEEPSGEKGRGRQDEPLASQGRASSTSREHEVRLDTQTTSLHPSPQKVTALTSPPSTPSDIGQQPPNQPINSTAVLPHEPEWASEMWRAAEETTSTTATEAPPSQSFFNTLTGEIIEAEKNGQPLAENDPNCIPLRSLLVQEEFPFTAGDFPKLEHGRWTEKELLDQGVQCMNLLGETSPSALTKTHLTKLHILGLGPTMYVFRNQFGSLGAFQQALEAYIGGSHRTDILDVSGWDNNDFISWGVRYMEANNGTLPTPSEIRQLSDRHAGPEVSAIISHFDDLDSFQAAAMAAYSTQREFEQTIREARLKDYARLVRRGMVPPEMNDQGEDAHLAFVSRFIVARACLPGWEIDGVYGELASGTNEAFISGLLARAARIGKSLTTGEIEMIASMHNVFDYIWPMNEHLQ